MAILFAGFVWIAVQFIKDGDACDMINDLDGLFRRTLLDKRCYILNGIEICDTLADHSGDFGLRAIDKGCSVAKAASAIAGISWYDQVTRGASDGRVLWLVTFGIAVRGMVTAGKGGYLKERQRVSRERIMSLSLREEAGTPASGGYNLQDLGVQKPSPTAAPHS